MMGTPTNDLDGCFWRADVEEAARDLLEVIREVRPQVIVTYDENGFYGHPDHIQAHRVAWRAYELAEGQVDKFYAAFKDAGVKVNPSSGFSWDPGWIVVSALRARANFGNIIQDTFIGANGTSIPFSKRCCLATRPRSRPER